MTLALCVIGEDGPSLWGRTTGERIRLQFAREGVSTGVTLAEAGHHDGGVVVIRADAAIDAPLVSILVKRRGFLLTADSSKGQAPIAAQVPGLQAASTAAAIMGMGSADMPCLSPAGLGADFWKTLRKRETPYAFVVAEQNRRAVEWRMFMGTYKGATDFVTKHLWPLPAFHVTRALAALAVTPNMVTLVAAALTALAFWLFLEGHFWLGIVAAWLMTFLDTVDGKLARTTLTSSRWGDFLDHGIDLVHPPFWYWAWGAGLAAHGFVWPPVTFWSVITAIVAGYVLQRVMEGIAIKWLGLEIHIWRKVDTLFRQVTARRNPNLVLLTLSLTIGRPDLGLLAVAIWTVLCLVLHALQLWQALIALRRGALTSWMTAP